MTTQTTYPTNNLVLRLSGGQRDGEMIPVSTQKCFLGMEANAKGETSNPQCAIFRGPKGAAVRSYASDVMVNGTASTVHWLKEGDRIAFPNSVSVEVAQLGWVEGETKDLNQVESQIQSRDVAQAASIRPASIQASSVQPATTKEVGSPQLDERLGTIESQISDIVSSNELTQSRFDGLDSRIESLVGQISKLVEVSSQTVDVTPKSEVFTQSSIESLGTSEVSVGPTVSVNRMPIIEDVQEEVVQQEVPQQEVLQQEVPQDVTALEEVTTDATVEETFVGPAAVQSPVEEAPESVEAPVSEFYSHTDDDDEKIITFDSTAEETPAPVADAENAEATEEPVLSGISQEEIDQRREEMARIFGSLTQEERTQEEPTQEEPALEDSTLEDSTQTVNEQPIEESTTLTHSQDSEVAQFTDNSTDISSVFNDDVETAIEPTESLQSDESSSQLEVSSQLEMDSQLDSSTQLEPNSLASQLLAGIEQERTSEDVEPQLTEQQLTEQQLPESQVAEQQMTEPEMTEPAAVEPTTAPDSGEKKNESVAELLARMNLNANIDDDGPQAEVEAEQPYETPAPAVEPEPISSVDDSSGGGEEDVEDYMNQLLNRMRGGKPAEEKPRAAPAAVAKPEVDEEEKAEDFVPPADPLKPEEFIPKQKATKLKSLDAMRELANTSARKAVRRSEEDARLKALGNVQIGIAIASFLMAIYFFFVGSDSFLDVKFCTGAVCLAICGYLGTRFYSTMKHNEEVIRLPMKVENTEPETETAE